MMQLIPKWKVTVLLAGVSHVFWVSDRCASNVLRKVADMDFSDSGLEQPALVKIEPAAALVNPSVSVTSGGIGGTTFQP
jgi:hypothetical protein